MSATMMFEVLISFVFMLKVCNGYIGRNFKIENTEKLDCRLGWLNVESNNNDLMELWC